MKFLKLALTAMALACAAIPAQAQNTLQDILSNGVLKVGTTGDWNPMTMKDPATNSYTGYDIDVMTELAKDLDVELEFVATDWKTLVSGVVSGKYHMTGSASISPARAKALVADVGQVRGPGSRRAAARRRPRARACEHALMHA
ncbi:MAG: transporter substrate-binding domain-containing protein, partial [Pseudomonadota bacterium]|nr:transporter substrate-binding domain-containing protein [Pseudomonadota bacterium]